MPTPQAPQGLDPSFMVNLQSLDFGEIITPDGRAHSLDALTPVSWVDSPAAGGVDTVPVAASVSTQPTGPSYTPPSASTTASTDSGGNTILSHFFHLPPHFGTRTVVAFIAIGLLLIVTARLVLTE